MDGFSEYSFKAVPDSKERRNQIILWVLAFAFLAGSFFWWVSLLPAMICFAAAWYYGTQLDYEIEYVFSDRDLEIDRIIQKSKRKQVLLLSYGQIAEIRVLPQGQTPKGTGEYASAPVSDFSESGKPKIELDTADKSGKRVIFITDAPEVRRFLISVLPKKAFILKKNS